MASVNHSTITSGLLDIDWTLHDVVCFPQEKLKYQQDAFQYYISEFILLTVDLSGVPIYWILGSSDKHGTASSGKLTVTIEYLVGVVFAFLPERL